MGPMNCAMGSSNQISAPAMVKVSTDKPSYQYFYYYYYGIMRETGYLAKSIFFFT